MAVQGSVPVLPSFTADHAWLISAGLQPWLIVTTLHPWLNFTVLHLTAALGWYRMTPIRSVPYDYYRACTVWLLSCWYRMTITGLAGCFRGKREMGVNLKLQLVAPVCWIWNSVLSLLRVYVHTAAAGLGRHGDKKLQEGDMNSMCLSLVGWLWLGGWWHAEWVAFSYYVLLILCGFKSRKGKSWN